MNESDIVFALSLSLGLNVLCIVYLFILINNINRVKNELSSHRKWFFEEFKGLLVQDFARAYADQRANFTVLWELFYVTLCVRGVIPCDPKNFITKGITDLHSRKPDIKDFYDIIPDLDQEKVFSQWKEFYSIAQQRIDEDRHQDSPRASS